MWRTRGYRSNHRKTYRCIGEGLDECQCQWEKVPASEWKRGAGVWLARIVSLLFARPQAITRANTAVFANQQLTLTLTQNLRDLF